MSSKKNPLSSFYVINLIIRSSENNLDLTPEEYSKIFLEFYNDNIRAASSREKECWLITCTEIKLTNKSSLFCGKLLEYTNIDRRKWFNVKKKMPDETFTVPEHLKANSIQSNYFFISDIHRFCYSYTTKENILPFNVEQFFKNAFETFLHKQYKGKYYSEINFEKKKETITEIIQADEILSLTINVSYSNGDFSDDAMRFFSDDMRSGNADEIELKIGNKNKEPINITGSRIIRGALENTASNGTAKASIKKNNKRIIINTVDHPAKYKVPALAEYEFAKNIYSFFKSLF